MAIAIGSRFRFEQALAVAKLVRSGRHWLLPFVVTTSIGVVHWWGSGTLYLSTLDAQTHQLLLNEKWATQRWRLSDLYIGYLTGLGVREPPSSLLLDLPNFFARIPDGVFREWPFFAISAFLLYLAVFAFSRQVGFSPLKASTASCLAVLAIVAPSPIRWTQFPLYTQSAILSLVWVLYLTKTILQCLDQCELKKIARNATIATALVVYGFFTFGVGMTILVIAVGLFLSPRLVVFLLSNARTRSQLVLSLMPLVVLLVVTFFSFDWLRNSAMWTHSSLSRGHRIASRDYWDFHLFPELDTSAVPFYKWIILGLVILGVVFGCKAKGLRYLLSTSAPLLACVAYSALARPLMSGLNREFLPDPVYIAFYCLPLFSLHLTQVLWAWPAIFTRRRTLKRKLFLSRVSLVLALLISVWAVVWLWDNHDLRYSKAPQSSQYQLLMETLSRISWPLGSNFKGRVLVAQIKSSEGVTDSTELLQPELFAQVLFRELRQRDVPNLATYSILLSGELATAFSRDFTDGTPMLRQHLAANRIPATRTLREYGIRYVIADQKIDDSNLRYVLTSDVHRVKNAVIHLYEVRDFESVATALTPSEALDVDLHSSKRKVPSVVSLLPIGDSGLNTQSAQAMVSRSPGELKVNVEASGPFALSLPFEFDNCYDVRITGNAIVGRVSNLFIGVVGRSSTSIEFTYSGRAWGLLPCR